jgi:hypothetical protein
MLEPCPTIRGIGNPLTMTAGEKHASGRTYVREGSFRVVAEKRVSADAHISTAAGVRATGEKLASGEASMSAGARIMATARRVLARIGMQARTLVPTQPIVHPHEWRMPESLADAPVLVLSAFIYAAWSLARRLRPR